EAEHGAANGAGDDGTQPRGDLAQRALDAFAPSASAALRSALMPMYDRQWGGFGGAPKFPQPSLLAALLHAADRDADPDAHEAVMSTFARMAEGGLYDQL